MNEEKVCMSHYRKKKSMKHPNLSQFNKRLITKRICALNLLIYNMRQVLYNDILAHMTEFNHQTGGREWEADKRLTDVQWGEGLIILPPLFPALSVISLSSRRWYDWFFGTA